MPKSKHGPALFELYGKGRGEESNPRGGSPRQKGESASAFRATLSSLAKAIGGGDGSAETRPAKPLDGERRPAFGLENGRVLLCLSSRGAGLGVFLILVFGCGVFATGRWVGRQSGFADGRKLERQSIQKGVVDEIEEARNSRPVDGLFADIGTSPIKAPSETEPEPQRTKDVPVALTSVAPAKTPWVRGNTYVVAQSFRGDARADAERARGYLAERGVDSEIFGSRERGFKLIGTKGFNMKDPTQKKLADRFAEKIRSVGKAYFKAGGRYRLEGYFATLKSDSW